MTNIICKISYGTDIRRFTTDRANLLSNVGWKALAKRVIDLFNLDKEWKAVRLTYVDDEGDRITITSEDELAEAVALACNSSPAVLRLAVPEDGAKTKPATAHVATNASKPATTEKSTSASPSLDGAAAAEDIAAFVSNLAKQLPGVVHQLPESLRTLLPQYELDVAATLAANAADEAASAVRVAAESSRAQRAASWRASAAGTDGAPGVHPGVTCDKSGMCPIVGVRYHLVGHNYDLCQDEYDKLSEEEKAKFEKIPPPRAPSVSQFFSPPGVHPGVECDRSGMCPIVGTRYHLNGHDYDLCQNEYDKLSEEEKRGYTAIPPPSPDLHGAAAAAASAFGAPFASALRSAFGGPWRRPPHGRGGPPGGHHHHHGPHGHHHAPPGCMGAPPGCGGPPGHGSHKLSARFVRDVTIFDGTQMPPSTPFTKIWRLKNNGEMPWPPGTKMLFVGGDQMTHEMAVPLSRTSPVMPGEEVDVAVSMTAPAELGRYLGYWRLVGPMGRRRFGHRVWCHVQVVDPQTTAAEAAEDIASMEADIEYKKAAVDVGADDDDDDEEEVGAALSAMDEEVPSGIPCTDAGGCAVHAPVSAEGVAASSMAGEVADAAVGVTDGTASDDGVLVDAADTSEPSAVALDKKGAASAVDADVTTAEGVKAALAAMGFDDAAMAEAALAKHGADLGACARDLAAASEWDALLDNLAEMGFANRELNKTLMLKHGGNVKRTVKELVEDA